MTSKMASLILLLSVLLTLAASLSSPLPHIDRLYTHLDPTTIITTSCGHQVSIYKNIRFAAPPVGALRFKYPQPLTTIPSSLPLPPDTQCTSSVPSLAPFPGINGTVFGSEDCLFLDVYVPSNLSASASVPVIHFLYGSAYAFGSKELFANPMGLYDELLSTKPARPFIFVASNYRMGLYGWASSPDKHDGMETNIGLADGIAALEWTQAHISKFGGDAKRVTAMGQSAGAGMIELMIANKHKKPLPFQRAFLSSSDLPLKRDVRERRKQLYGYILKLANCMDMACLRSLPEDILAAVNDILISKTLAGGGGGTFGPYLGFGPFVSLSPPPV